MVYHSVPDPNKTYPGNMTNFELTKFEIHNAYFTPDNLIDHVDATVTTFFPREMTLTRTEVIGFMARQGFNFYFNSKPLFIDLVNATPYIHHEKSLLTRDILE